MSTGSVPTQNLLVSGEDLAYKRPEDIVAVFVAGQIRYGILPSEKPFLWTLQSATQPGPQSILFG